MHVADSGLQVICLQSGYRTHCQSFPGNNWKFIKMTGIWYIADC